MERADGPLKRLREHGRTATESGSAAAAGDPQDMRAKVDRGPRIRSEGAWRGGRVDAGTLFVMACVRGGCLRPTAWGRDLLAGNAPS